jgi:hypothetical protein
MAICVQRELQVEGSEVKYFFEGAANLFPDEARLESLS